MFERVDTGDDRRVNVDEFIQALPMLEEWGGDAVDDPEGEFYNRFIIYYLPWYK